MLFGFTFEHGVWHITDFLWHMVPVISCPETKSVSSEFQFKFLHFEEFIIIWESIIRHCGLENFIEIQNWFSVINFLYVVYAQLRTEFRQKLLDSKHVVLFDLYWKVLQFWKIWGLRNCLLKMNVLYLIYHPDHLWPQLLSTLDWC